MILSEAQGSDERYCGNEAKKESFHPRRDYHSSSKLLFARMTLFFYNVALALVFLLGSPYWLFRILTTEKYRQGLKERLGHVPHRILDAADPRPVIWLHAVSVGEVLSVARLIPELQAALPDHRIVVSSTTVAGQTLARTRFGEKNVFYSPLDLAFAVRRYFNALQPALLILVETEFWPNMLAECGRRHIPVTVTNARISDRSFPRYRKLKKLWQPFFRSLTLVLAQSEEDTTRLKTIGVPSDRVRFGGNLKFDVRTTTSAAVTVALESHLPAGTQLIVAGSTLDGEEAALLDLWPKLTAKNPQLFLVLAPRHTDRFPAVEKLLNESGLSWTKRSHWMDSPKLLPSGGILLLDSIGELASIYSLATIAFVGGSLVPLGGHNPLEPAQFGVPVVTGADYANFRAIVEELRRHNAICITEAKNLLTTFTKLLEDPAKARAIGTRAREVFEKQAGATGRTVSAIRTLLGESCRT
jgi:3-deoxy-D-manno-octulosonic-acid transferase